MEISILGTPYSFKQRKEETVAEFKVRLQKELDKLNFNIKVQ